MHLSIILNLCMQVYSIPYTTTSDEVDSLFQIDPTHDKYQYNKQKTTRSYSS